MKMRTSFSAAIVVFAALLLSSCCLCRKAAKNAVPFAGTVWSLVEYQGQAFEAQDNYLVVFDDQEKTASGVADCNSFISDYTSDMYNKILVENKALTRAMCANDAMEQAFLDMLQSAGSFSIDGNYLLWLKNGELLGKFEAKESAPAQ